MFNVKMDRMTQTLTCRVQYLNDIDPFRASTNFPEPPRPPLHSFNVNIPLVNQIAGVHRLLQAPHRVSNQLTISINPKQSSFPFQSS